MHKRLIVGALVGVAVYAGRRWLIERKDFPNGVPLGNIFRVIDPFFYGFAAAGAAVAYATK